MNNSYQVRCGDNVEILKNTINDDSIDLIVTSPPYDNLRDYKGFSFDIDSLIFELYRILKPGGVIIWNVADATVNGTRTLTSFKQALKFSEAGFFSHDIMIYEKGNFSNPSRNRYHSIWEFMFVFSKGKPKTFNPIKDKPITGVINPSHGRAGTFGKNTTRQKDGTMKAQPTSLVLSDMGMRTNIWRLKTAGQERPGKAIEHPAKMPNAMARDHIISWSNPGDLILDPFGGSGTTGVEALKLDRRFIGIDISSEFCEMMNKNLLALAPWTSWDDTNSTSESDPK